MILKNEAKPGLRVTLAVHRTKTVKAKTLTSILAQAGLTIDQFVELI